MQVKDFILQQPNLSTEDLTSHWYLEIKTYIIKKGTKPSNRRRQP